MERKREGLAQTPRHLQFTAGAFTVFAVAAGLYALRARMSDGDEEAWHALYMTACTEVRYNVIRGIEQLLECFRRRPERMEPVHIIEQVCHQMRQQTPLPSEGSLFVLPDAYLAEPQPAKELRCSMCDGIGGEHSSDCALGPGA